METVTTVIEFVGAVVTTPLVVLAAYALVRFLWYAGNQMKEGRLKL